MSSCGCSRRSFLRLAALGATAGLATPALAAPALAGPSSLADVPRLRPGGPALVGGLRVLAGSLHDHSTDSDGDAPSATIAAYIRAHARELGLDFFSLTEHSDFFPESLGGADPWARSLSVCDHYSGDGFAFLRGFEWTNDQQNHLNVLGSAGWLRRDESFTMTPFWRWLSTAPGPYAGGLAPSLGGSDGVGQFNHPASKGPLNWDDYTYDAAAAQRMATIEVRGKAAGWYWFALSRGWRVGPVMNADFHPWQASGLLANPRPGAGTDGAGFYPGERSLVIARDASRGALLNALRARRTAATDRPDLWGTLRTESGQWMGSRVAAAPGSTLRLVVDAGTAASRIASVSLVQDVPFSSTVAQHFYGDNPVESWDNQHAAAYAEQHRRYLLSGGKATFKGELDTPPRGATIRTVDWPTGARTARLRWSVPRTRSPRPDGAHWVYAVVRRADGAKVTTAPLLVQA